MIRATLAVVLALAAVLPAWGMTDADRQLIELTNRDLVPRGSRMPEQRGTVLYGQVDQSAVHAAQGNALDAVRPFYLGLFGRETLDGGYAAYARIEASIDDDSRDRFFDRAALVGWGDPAVGWVEAGRMQQPASQVAEIADPWSGASTVAANARLLYGGQGTRSERSLYARSSERLPLDVRVQAAVQPGSAPAGASLGWRGGAWYLAAGVQRWPGGQWVVPLAGRWRLGFGEATAGYSRGTLDGRRVQALVLGGRYEQPTGAHRWTWLGSLALARRDGEPDRASAAAGADYRLSALTGLHAEAQLTRPAGLASRLAFAVGLRHQFNLR